TLSSRPRSMLCAGIGASTGASLGTATTVMVKRCSLNAPFGSVTRTTTSRGPATPVATQWNTPSAPTVAPAGPLTSDQTSVSAASSVSLADSGTVSALPCSTLCGAIGARTGAAL